MTAKGAVSPVAVRPGEGRLTKPTAATQPWRRQLVFMPGSGLSGPHPHQNPALEFVSLSFYCELQAPVEHWASRG